MGRLQVDVTVTFARLSNRQYVENVQHSDFANRLATKMISPNFHDDTVCREKI